MMLRIFAMNVEGLDFTKKRWNGYFSEERIRTASRIRQDHQRQLFLGAEALLNRSLEIMGISVSLPAAYTRNRYGKPYFDDVQGLYVNWSHSGSFVICALSDQEVGIDLQNTCKEPKNALVHRFLQAEELIYYNQATDRQKKLLFYAYWTAKESFLKALGTGFGTSLNHFYIRMEKQAVEVIRRDGEIPYTCWFLNFKEKDYMAAVCIKGKHPDKKSFFIEFVDP